MTTSPREVLTRYHRAMLDKSADDLADLYAADGVHEFPFTSPGFPDRYVGRERIRAGYAAIWGASPTRVHRIEQVAVHDTTDPEVLIAEHVAIGAVGADGRPFDVPGLLVLRVRTGRIVLTRDYMDALGVGLAMGRLSLAGPAGSATD
ncbi:nuclear transport factor 2 family protein [Embleya sp. AB8]|uniref:nuclear transport factor 2 family protein n=1 Tax=Embleya sp. AB8 TaxID=3156304 RepID=UPI003C79583A